MSIINLIGRDLVCGTLLSYLATKRIRQAVHESIMETKVDLTVTTVSAPESVASVSSSGAAFLAGVLIAYINPIPTSKVYGGVGTVLALVGD